MKTTVDFLNDVKAKYGLTSNYALARKLNQTDTAIARWMHGKNTLGDESAVKVAELLEIEPAFVMACAAAERSKSAKVKKAWEWTAHHLGGLAAALALVAVLPFITLPFITLPDNSSGMMRVFDNNVFYASQNIHYANFALCGLFIIIIALLVFPKGKSDDSKRR